MTAAHKIEPLISPLLTWKEICERYPDQHVRLVEVERAAAGSPQILSARVIGSGRTRKDAYLQAELWGDRFFEVTNRFTGVLITADRCEVIIHVEVRD